MAFSQGYPLKIMEKSATKKGVAFIPKADSFGLKQRAFIASIILAIISFTMFRDSLLVLINSVMNREGSSHGLFVPIISLYLIWFNLDEILASKLRFDAIWCGVFIFLSMIILATAETNNKVILENLALLTISAGVFLGVFGREFFKKIWFPLFFLGTMIPLPEELYVQIAELMRTMTTWGAVGVLKLADFPYLREGFNLHFPQHHLYVDHSCSGVRYLLSYLVFGVAYAFRFKDTIGGRFAVIACAVPLAVLGGILRLSFIFISVFYVGDLLATGRSHVVFSWSVFTAVLIGAIVVDQAFDRRRRSKR
jgi:exosortase